MTIRTQHGLSRWHIESSGIGLRHSTMKFQKKILLIDHEPSVTRLIRRALERAGKYLIREEHDKLAPTPRVGFSPISFSSTPPARIVPTSNARSTQRPNEATRVTSNALIRACYDPICFLYASASFRFLRSSALSILRTKIQPCPYGSRLIRPGSASSALFTSTTVPLTGA
jgi:hypothetical protein